jgi:Spy/CpxP family protein refolding chaperone
MKIDCKQVSVALLLGGIIGFAGARYSAPHFPYKRWEKRGEFKEKMMERFSKKLNLTQEQRAEISSIFEEGRKKIEEMQSEMRPKFEEMRAETNAKIRAILDPGQQKKFDEMEADWGKRMKQFHGRHPARFGSEEKVSTPPPTSPEEP